MAKPRIAAGDLCLGHHGVIPAGAEVPATYLDMRNAEQPTDFDRLEQMGLLEPDATKTPTRAAPPPDPGKTPATGQSSDQDRGGGGASPAPPPPSSYRELVERAKQLGIKFAGVKRELLEKAVADAERAAAG